MKIFSASNTNNSASLIVADTDNKAKEIGLNVRLARKADNIKLKDITAEYIASHGPSGFDLETLEEGVLVQRISGNKSTWETFIH